MAEATRFLGTLFYRKDIYQTAQAVSTILLFVYAAFKILNPSWRIFIAAFTSLS